MTQEQMRTAEKKGLALVTGRGEGSSEFMDSPTYALSRMPFAERLWVMSFMEAVIAIENDAVEEFDPDFLMAVNEYLVRRSDLSVRMLNYWLPGRDFRSMQQVTDYLNERYRMTAAYIQDNEVACRRAVRSSGEGFLKAWENAVHCVESLPEEIVPYDAKLGGALFRQNPVAFLLSVREEERLRYIALLSMVIYEHRAAVRSARGRKTGDLPGLRKFIRVFGNLLNTYIKYPEDPEIQALLLSVHMPMDRESFRDDDKRRAFFNDRLRMAAYRWFVNRRGCRQAIIDKWEEYGTFFRRLPDDPAEPAVPALFLDEAVLNIPDFREDPNRFMHYQLTAEQCCHLLTMLGAVENEPEMAALGALLLSRCLHEGRSADVRDADAFFGWEIADEEERSAKIRDRVRRLVLLWRTNDRNCRKDVKAGWEAYERAYQHVTEQRVVPEQLYPYARLLEKEAFLEDPFVLVKEMGEQERLRFNALCSGLCGLGADDAATVALAVSVWMDNTANTEVLQIFNRLLGGRVTQAEGSAVLLRDFYERAVVSWKYNYGGFRAAVLEDPEKYFTVLTERISASREAEYEEEFRNFDAIIKDEGFQEDPPAYLRQMSQVQCVRFLVFIAALSGAAPDRAAAFAAMIKNLLFYPNDGLRKRFDSMLEQHFDTDGERAEHIGAMLKETTAAAMEDPAVTAAARDGWQAYSEAFMRHQERERSLQWDLTEKNVRRLFRICMAGRGAAVQAPGESTETVEVDLLGGEKAVGTRYRKVRMLAGRLYSDRTGTILRSMLSQLEVLHHMREHGGHSAFYLDGMRACRRPYGQREIWTESMYPVFQLLYLAVGTELIAPLKEVLPPGECTPETVVFLDRAGAPYIEVPPRG